MALEWGCGWEEGCIWGVENSGSLGKGFAQFLLEQGEQEVRESAARQPALIRLNSTPHPPLQRIGTSTQIPPLAGL